MPNRKTSSCGIEVTIEKMSLAGIPYGTRVQFMRGDTPCVGRVINLYGPESDHMLVIKDEMEDTPVMRLFSEVVLIGDRGT